MASSDVPVIIVVVEVSTPAYETCAVNPEVGKLTPLKVKTVPSGEMEVEDT